MKKVAVFIVLMSLAWGCNEPETLVVNTVMRDGSISRKIVYTSEKDTLDFTLIRVPADTGWEISRTMEIMEGVEEGPDTVFVYTLEKQFANVEEINNLYLKGGDKNQNLSRRSEFHNHFRWFTSKIVFSEVVDPVFEGFPPSEYFSEKELELFYMPEELKESKFNSPDSTMYKTLQDSLDSKHDTWLTESLVNQWIVYVTKLAVESGKESPKAILDMHLTTLADSLDDSDGDEFEVLGAIVGIDFLNNYKPEIDSALILLEGLIEKIMSAGSYTVGIEMPGKLTATNGYSVENSGLRWSVRDDYYLCEPYVIRAESIVPNKWTWFVTLAFILFVIVGIGRRERKR